MQASGSLLTDRPDRAQRRVARFRLFERLALLLAWALVIVGFGVAIPNGTYLTWTNFSVLFTSQAPAALLALALIVPLTAGDYDLSVGRERHARRDDDRRAERAGGLAARRRAAAHLGERSRRRAGERLLHRLRPHSVARGDAGDGVAHHGDRAMDERLVHDQRHLPLAAGHGRWRTAVRPRLRVLLRADRRRRDVVRVRIHPDRSQAAVRGSRAGGRTAVGHQRRPGPGGLPRGIRACSPPSPASSTPAFWGQPTRSRA